MEIYMKNGTAISIISNTSKFLERINNLKENNKEFLTFFDKNGAVIGAININEITYFIDEEDRDENN